MSPTLDPAGFAEIAGTCPPAVAESARRARNLVLEIAEWQALTAQYDSTAD